MDIGFGGADSRAVGDTRANLTEFRPGGRNGLGYPVTVDVPAAWPDPGPGRGLAPVYQSVLDPMVSLGFSPPPPTSSIRLGVAVVNHPFRLAAAARQAGGDRRTCLSGGPASTLGIRQRAGCPRSSTGSGGVDGRAAARGPRSTLAALRRAGGPVTRASPAPINTIPAWPAGPAARAAAGTRPILPRRPMSPGRRWKRAGRIADGWVHRGAAAGPVTDRREGPRRIVQETAAGAGGAGRCGSSAV